jgi:hypothetical protein
MRGVLRWVKRIVIGALALTIIVTGVAMVILHTAWGRGRIKRSVEVSLADQFPGGVKVGELEGSIFGELVLSDVVIAAIDKQPAITIKTVRVRIGLSGLLEKTARIDRLIADQVKVAVGRSPLTPPKPPPTEPVSPSAWSVELPDLEVHHGTLEIAGEHPVAIDGLDLSGSLEIPAGSPMAAKVRVLGTWRERQLPVDVAADVKIGSTVAIPFAMATLGGINLSASDVVIDPDHLVGTVNADASPEAVAAAIPELELPAHARITVVANGEHLDLIGSLGTASLRGAVRANLKTKTASGIIGAADVDVAQLTHGKVKGSGDVSVAFDASMTGARGVVGLRGAYADLPPGHALVMFKTTRDHADVTVLATSAGETNAVTTATLAWHGKQVDVEKARVIASSTDMNAASGGRVRVAGHVRADASLSKKGSLSPKLELDFIGTAVAQRLAYTKTSVGYADATFGGSVGGTLAAVTFVATANANAKNVSQAGTAVGSGTVHADYQRDKTILAKVHAVPSAAAVVVDVTALVTPGEVIDIALRDHAIKPATGAPWIGKGGTVKIADRSITVRGVTTTNGDGKLAIQADIGRGTGTLDAKLDATAVPVAAIDPTFRGSVSGKVELKQRGTKWTGSGKLLGTNLVFSPEVPVLDGGVDVAIDGRHITLVADASNPAIGKAKLALDLDGPTDLTNIPAWRKLDRSAVHQAKITVTHVDLASVASTGGTIDGSVTIAGPATTGSLDVRGVTTKIGTVEGVVSFSPLDQDLFASWNAKVSELGEASVGIQIGFPDHVFDPLAWKQLGRGVVHSLTASLDDIVIDPVKLAKLGIDAPLRGHASVHLAVGSAAAMATLTVAAKGVQGGPLALPIDATVTAKTDSRGTTATACVARSATKDTRGGACVEEGLVSAMAPPALISIDNLALPVSFDRWLTAPKSALTAALTGELTVPSQDAPPVLAVFGRKDFVAGRLDGKIAVGGVLGKPTGHALFATHDLRMVSAIVGRTIPTLNLMKLEAMWNGADGSIDVEALESNKGELRMHAEGKPSELGTVVAKFTATAFDLAPLTAFLPGALAASQGRLRGVVTVTSLDPATRTIRGDLHLVDGSIPITPVIGTLRDATADLTMRDTGMILTAKGTLGGARNPNVHLDADAPNDVSKIGATLVVERVSPLAEFEPIINGTVRFDLLRDGKKLTGDIHVKKARVRVPPRTGDKLLAAITPDDLFDIEHPPDIKFGLANAREPVRPWLNARLIIDPTPLEVDLEDYQAQASIVSNQLTVAVGDTVGLDGAIAIEYGDATIFSRRYQIEPTSTAVVFRGTIDPEINFKFSHQFATLTLTAIVRGNVSDADFPHRPEFVADKGSYTQNQLFNFFLGAEPGDDASSEARGAVAGIGTSYLSSRLSQRLNKYLPKKLRLDLKCEPGTSTASASCTAGKRYFDNRLYVSLRHRLTPRLDENIENLDAEYYLSREWLLQGSGGDRVILGADLLWRRRW